MSFVIFILSTVSYIVVAGITYGYAKHRWPRKIEYNYLQSANVDVNFGNRVTSTIMWPFYWVFIWPFTKANEATFSALEKRAARQVMANKARVSDLQATRAELEESNAELEKAEVELEKEIAKGL